MRSLQIHSLAAAASICSIGLDGPGGDDVIGDQSGADSSGVSTDSAYASVGGGSTAIYPAQRDFGDENPEDDEDSSRFAAAV